MSNRPPYNPYANCCAPCGYNPNANCATQNINYANALNVDDIIKPLRPMPCDPVYRITNEPPCRDYQPKYDFRNNGEIYEIVAVQESDE